MAIDLNKYIKNLQKKQATLTGKGGFGNKIKAFALEIQTMFVDNIGKDRITPKTNKKTGKTLFDKGLGVKSITYDKKKLKEGIISIGNSREYMGYHLDSGKERKKLPIRNWLMKPPHLDKVVQAWIRELMRS